MTFARSLWLRLRRTLRRMLGREPWHRRDVRVPTIRLGSAYGGWTFVPDGIDARSVIYSFGVGEDITFDLALIERFGVEVHAFDPTPRVAAWLTRQDLPDRFRFYPTGLGASDEKARFYPPANPAHVSHSIREVSSGTPIEVELRRLSTIMAELGHDRVDLLKLDIEGAEYGAIEDLIASGIRVDQLLVEFHHQSVAAGRETAEAVQALRSAGYAVFHISPSGTDYGFLRA